MRSKSSLLNLALTLLGILGISAFLILLGKHDSSSFPSAASYEPSGASAFQQLLRTNGYPVLVDRSAIPALKRGDIAVVFDLKQDFSSSLFGGEESRKQSEALHEAIAGFVKTGGVVVTLPISEEFAAASRDTLHKKTTIKSIDGDTATVTWSGIDRGGFVESNPDSEQALWEGDSPFVELRHFRSGTEVAFADGIVATNRFIDQAENAKVLMDALSRQARRGSRFVFVEASIGNAREVSLMEMIGPWAKAAWMQLLLLGVVVLYTLGKPFGLPTPERRRQYGARELLDAMADTLMRGRMSKVALGSVHEEAKRLIARRFGSTTAAARDGESTAQLEELKKSMASVEAALQLNPPEAQSVRLVSDLDRSLRNIEGSKHEPRAPR